MKGKSSFNQAISSLALYLNDRGENGMRWLNGNISRESDPQVNRGLSQSSFMCISLLFALQHLHLKTDSVVCIVEDFIFDFILKMECDEHACISKVY